MQPTLDIVILGLSITSSWGNGHATTFRALVRALHGRGHRVRFLERDVPWYASNRDMPKPEFCETCLYESLEELQDRYAEAIRTADLVMVGSFVPEGVPVGEWVCNTAQGVTAFYDIDTPVTLSKLSQGDYEYLSPELIPRYDLYLSFTGGPTLKFLEQHYQSPRARPLYCSVDPELYSPMKLQPEYELGYMGTYSDDRQPTLDRLLLQPARRLPERQFAVAGPSYPADIQWPENVLRIEHLSPAEHCRFYNRQRFTLNVTRAAMIRAGYAPSVRLFEAAACGTPLISDWWNGLEEFFRPGEEILIAHDADEMKHLLLTTTEEQRSALAERARQRVLDKHTAAHRAMELEQYAHEVQNPTATLT